MPNVFVTSDTHFSQGNICLWVDAAGVKARPWATPEEMDEELVARWNAVVRPGDRVYHLGDVSIPRRGLQHVARCHGKKVLVKGNHDIFKLKDYTAFFEDIRSYIVKSYAVFSHVPLHPSSFARFNVNIHGHTHKNHVHSPDGTLDPRYINVCVEQTNYAPVPIEMLQEQCRAARDAIANLRDSELNRRQDDGTTG